MTWYAAHIVLLTKFLDSVQDSYPVWENVVLINAATSDEAYAIADRKGNAEAAVENHTYNGRPAAWVYMGTCIRWYGRTWYGSNLFFICSAG